MALNYITLVLDLADGTGTPLATGQALLNPSAQVTDATDDMIVTKAQLSARLAGRTRRCGCSPPRSPAPR